MLFHENDCAAVFHVCQPSQFRPRASGTARDDSLAIRHSFASLRMIASQLRPHNMMAGM